MFPDINKILAEVAAFSTLLNAALTAVNELKEINSGLRAEVAELKTTVHAANSSVSQLVVAFAPTADGSDSATA